MRTNSKSLPQRLLDLGNGKYHINYNVVQSEDENGDPEFNYDTATINGEPTYDNIVIGIISEKYSTFQEAALINNYNEDSNTDEYVDYLQYRELAKHIASQENLLTSEQIDEFKDSIKKIKVTIPIVKVLTGNIYADLADMLLKKRAIYSATDTHVKVYLSYLLPEHRAILEADEEVTIE